MFGAVGGWIGLSPRVRGNLGHCCSLRVGLGSIPACAGEPSMTDAGRTQSTVYPRVCGGTAGCLRPSLLPQGLSPRVRGNQREAVGRSGWWGSIPACAGEPFASRSADREPRVYPRVCGGTYGIGIVGVHIGGLSPRVRGNPAQASRAVQPTGSIPACAGEPPDMCCPTTQSSVYPRVCGGTPSLLLCRATAIGLSPRVRGNQLSLVGFIEQGGSIPACAGEPFPPQNGTAQPGVYPRVCGGTFSSSAVSRLAKGLSPRVRGNPFSTPRKSSE